MARKTWVSSPVSREVWPTLRVRRGGGRKKMTTNCRGDGDHCFDASHPHIWLQSEIVHAMKSEMIAVYLKNWEFLQLSEVWWIGVRQNNCKLRTTKKLTKLMAWISEVTCWELKRAVVSQKITNCLLGIFLSSCHMTLEVCILQEIRWTPTWWRNRAGI